MRWRPNSPCRLNAIRLFPSKTGCFLLFRECIACIAEDDCVNSISRISPSPVPDQGIGCLSQPIRIVAQSLQFACGKVFLAIHCWMTERFQHLGSDQNRNVTGVYPQKPCRLVHGQPRRQSLQGQECCLIGTQTPSFCCNASTMANNSPLRGSTHSSMGKKPFS